MRVELVAAEPLVASPVAMCFDERGRMFVCEGRSYPSEPGDGTGPQGVIAMLEPDAQGNYTKRKVFADGLNFPSGIMAWRGGVIAACSAGSHLLERHRR